MRIPLRSVLSLDLLGQIPLKKMISFSSVDASRRDASHRDAMHRVATRCVASRRCVVTQRVASRCVAMRPVYLDQLKTKTGNWRIFSQQVEHGKNVFFIFSVAITTTRTTIRSTAKKTMPMQTLHDPTNADADIGKFFPPTEGHSILVPENTFMLSKVKHWS